MSPPTGGAALKSYAGISPSRYRHTRDLAADQLLRANGGLDELTHMFSEHVLERSARVENLANNLRVGPRQLPGLHAIFEECCETLGVAQPIELYLGQGFNAWTSGVDAPYIVIGHELLAAAPTTDFLRFIIGHELGHVLCEHVHYHQLARWATAAAEALPSLGGLLRRGLDCALYDWYRSAEFSADRAGLLACQNLDSSARLLMLFGGYPMSLVRHFNIAECTEQAAALSEETQGLVSKLMRFQSEVFMDHPWPILRAAELCLWHESAEFAQLGSEAVSRLAANRNPVLSLPSSWHCEECGACIVHGDRFCTGCGSPTTRPGKEASV